MELNVYDILKKPVVSTKSVTLYKKLGQITFEIHSHANKVMVREAVEKIWNVKVDKVRVVKIPGKVKLYAKKEFKSPDRKKAVVTLEKGYKIEIPGMMETMGATEAIDAKAGAGVQGS